MQKPFIYLILLCFLGLYSIASAESKTSYAQSYNQVFDTIIDLLEESDYVIVTEDRERGRIRTDYKVRGRFLGDFRIRYGIRVKPNEDAIEVRANCSAAARLKVAIDSGGSGRDWSEVSGKKKEKFIKEFFNELNERLR